MEKIICFCKWRQDLAPVELAKKLKSLGFDGADLPCRPGAPVTHANGPRKLPEYHKALKDEGLTLERLVTNISEVNAETEKLLDAIRKLGVKKIRINWGSLGDADPRAKIDEARRKLYALQKLLEKYGISGGIQNHSGNGLEVNISCVLHLLRDCDPKWVGIQYDPGHATISGEPIKLAIGLMGPYLHSVNLKSPRQEYFIEPATGRLTYKPIWVPLRDGMLNVSGLLNALKKAGYRDALSIHAEYRSYFHYVENDKEATDKLVAEDVRHVRQALKNI